MDRTLDAEMQVHEILHDVGNRGSFEVILKAEVNFGGVTNHSRTCHIAKPTRAQRCRSLEKICKYDELCYLSYAHRSDILV